MAKKLIIWDFDGVIANTEYYWLYNRQKVLQEQMGIDWDWSTINRTLRGISDKTKREKLSALGIKTSDSFWEDILKLDDEIIRTGKIKLTHGIEYIFKLDIKQCIATGGIKGKTATKIENVGIRTYFPDNHVFTAEMVEHGKPAPDLFLLACEKMNVRPEETIVIEDSSAGLQAALTAGCTPIAFLEFYNQDDDYYLEKIKNMKLPYMCQTMAEVKKIVESLL